MKFLLEYLVCCFTCSISEASPSLPADDSRSLVLPESNHYRNCKKCSITASKSCSAADWRPSLNTISEDNIVAVKRRNSATVGSETTLKRKVSPKPESQLRYRHSEDYGRSPVPGIIPAFSPTPFLF